MGTKQLNETIASNNHGDKGTGWASGEGSGDSHPPPDSYTEIQGMQGKGHPSVASGNRVIAILHLGFKDIVKRESGKNLPAYIFLECCRHLYLQGTLFSVSWDDVSFIFLRAPQDVFLRCNG